MVKQTDASSPSVLFLFFRHVTPPHTTPHFSCMLHLIFFRFFTKVSFNHLSLQLVVVHADYVVLSLWWELAYSQLVGNDALQKAGQDCFLIDRLMFHWYCDDQRNPNHSLATNHGKTPLWHSKVLKPVFGERVHMWVKSPLAHKNLLFG